MILSRRRGQTLRPPLGAERGAAPARAGRMRVVGDEPLAQQARVVIEHASVEQAQALWIDEHASPLWSGEDRIAGGRRRCPSERIFEARAPARLHAEAQ